MSTRAQVLERITRFLAHHPMSERQFGIAAAGDHRFVARLRKGAATLRIIERAELFMHEREAGGETPPAIRKGETNARA